MNKSIFFLFGFLFVILVLIHSTDGKWIKSRFGKHIPRTDENNMDEGPIDQKRNISPGRSRTTKAEQRNSPRRTRKSSTTSNESKSREKRPNGMSKNAIKKREAARSENILAGLEVRVASKGYLRERDVNQAAVFKAKVIKRSEAKGLSDTFVVTGESCANGTGNLYKKYYLSKKEVIYEVCFDDLTSTAIYTTHISKQFNEKTKTDRKAMDTKWNAHYLLSLWNIDFYYAKKSQKAEFDRIYGGKQKYVEIDGSNWYAHAHLTPHGDFITEAEQLSTYEHHNCVAGKQSVNNGNWKKIENYGRGLIKDYKTDILVFTGVYKQLELRVKSTGKLAKAWLNEKDHRLAVPKIHFKLYINPTTNASVAFFTSNDTNMGDEGTKEFRSMCDDRCKDIEFVPRDDVESGITICCTYAQFRKHIKFLPIKLEIESKLFKRTAREISPSRSRSRSPSPKR